MTVHIQASDLPALLSLSGGTDISNPTASVMIYGAIEAYEFYEENGLTTEAALAQQFLTGLQANYTFSDGYAQKTLNDFCSKVGDFNTLKTWWDGLKTNGLVSTDPTQPKISLLDWTENNVSNFDPANLDGGQFLNTSNYTLYSDMFFLGLEKENTDSPELPSAIDQFFQDTTEGSAHARELCLQLYHQYGNPNPTDPNWKAFSSEVTKLYNTLDSTGQKLGTYINLLGIANGEYPDQYTSFQDFMLNGDAPSGSAWSIWGNYENDVYSLIVADYTKFETDLKKGDINAAVQDYIKTRSDNLAKGSLYKQAEQELSAAADAWAKSINISVALIKVTGVSDGASGDLYGTVLNGSGTPVSLYDYLTNSDISNCTTTDAEFGYTSDDDNGGIYNAKTGNTIVTVHGTVHDSDVFDNGLNQPSAFNGDFTFWDETGDDSEFIIGAKGNLSSFMRDGLVNYIDPNNQSPTAAATIAQILQTIPPPR